MADDFISIERALNRAEPEMRAAFLEMIGMMQGAISLTDLARMIEQGRLEEAFASMLGASAKLGTAYNSAFMDAANDVARQLNRSVGEIIIDFDQTNDFAVAAMKQNRLRLIQGFTHQQREATREALLEGMRRGANPIEQARNFRDSVGLTANQVRAVNNYRRALEEGDSGALARQLRDRRFDPTVRRSLESGTPLSKQQVDKMVERYRQRYITYRANMIARTEALRSVHEGADAEFRQAIENGQIDPNNMTQEWNTARDERVRGSHRTMHNQTVQLGEQFTSGNGRKTKYPGGFGVASEDIHCRCTVGTRMTSLSVQGGVQVEVIG